MKIKILYLSFIYFFLMCYSGNAQKFDPGLQTDLKTMVTSEIYYANSSSSSQNIFYSKYVICGRPASDTLYVVDFIFNRNNDSIEIKQEDKLLDLSSTRAIKFKALSYSIKPSDAKPYYCIKNYECNDTTLSLSDKNLEILFTIADTTNPEIFLNQINSLDGNYNFSLIKLRNVYLAPHKIHAQDYWEWYVADSAQRAQDSLLIEQQRLRYLAIQADIDKEIIKIQADKDSLIVMLTEKRLFYNLSKFPADENWQNLFALKMDTFCLNYLGKTYNLNTEVSVTFEITSSYDPELPVVTEKAQVPDTIRETSQLGLMIQTIDKEIKRFNFENKKVEICPEGPYTIINNNHLARCEKLKIDMAEMNLPFDTVFASVLQTVNNDKELLQFSEKVELTTTYRYSFKYKSESMTQTWFYRNGKIKDPNDTLISDKENVAIFNKKFPDAKNGKYTVRLNTAVLNDSTIGPDLDHVFRKYKYISQVGFNMGTFVSKGDLSEGNDTYDGKLLYWNIFLIYHHYGIFGGKNFANSTGINDYYEGGVYLAPGNYFYFKLGLAKYNGTNFSNKVLPIIGASLIFPVFQLEGGYNFSLNYPYIMIGFNFPYNI